MQNVKCKRLDLLTITGFSSFFILHFAFCILYFLSPTTCFAQLSGVHSFSISANGNSPHFLSLSKCSQGYMLAGTTNGLYRFDGNRFTAYNISKQIKSTAVTAIAEDKSKTVWVGFSSGEIGFVNNKTVELLKAEEGHPAVAITFILTDTLHSTTYFATAGEGIYYYTNKRFYNINTDDGLSDNYVYEMYADHAGIIACTDRGINNIGIQNKKKSIHSFTSVNGLPDNIVRCLCPYSKGNCKIYCVGMQDKGIGYYNNGSFSYGGKWAYGQVNSMLVSDGQLWVATEDKGIVILRYSGFPSDVLSVKAFGEAFGKAKNLLADDEGNVWFTSKDKLVRTNGAHLQNIVPLEEKIYAQVHTLLADCRGNIWTNVNDGLRKYSFSKEQQKWGAQHIPLSLINAKSDITCLYEGPYGNIWAGTLGHGIILIDPVTGKTRNLSEEHLLIDGSILSISGKNNDVWISSLGGVVHCRLTDANRDIFQRYAFETFDEVNNVGSHYIYSIFIDSKNRVWFATDGRGIIVYDNGSFKAYNQNNGIRNPVIYNVCEGGDGSIWFSSLNNGVYKLEGEKLTNIAVADGLNDATITSLAADSKGNIIAISIKGINIINPEDNSISYLDANQEAEQVNADLNCISKQDGIYVVGNKGIFRYVPVATFLKPKIALDGVQLFLKEVPQAHQPFYDYDENNFTFSYTGISFSHPDKVTYQYRLEGLSSEWVLTKDNSINFPKLSPGNYVFRVRASINNKFSGSDEASYSFKIRKPFWWRWWFIVMAMATVAGCILWYVKAREKRVKRWERNEKEKIQSQFETLKSQVNPHFLFNSFNTLISVIEDSSPLDAVKYVEHLSDLYRKIVVHRDKDLITVKEECEIIGDYFFIQKKRFGESLQFKSYVSKEDQAKCLIAPLTLQLLTENAVKHNAISAETPLLIELYVEGRSLVVRNNLNKKLSVEKSAGMGLQNIQKRYHLLANMEIAISKTEKFFTVHIPLITPEA